jgi:hypothetical protein
VNLWRDFEVRDGDGDAIISSDAKPSALAGLSGSIRF